MKSITGNRVTEGADSQLASQEWRCPNCGSKKEPVDGYYCHGTDTECYSDLMESAECDIYYLGRLSFIQRVLYRLKSKAKKIEAIRADCRKCKPAVMCESCGHLERE